MITPRALELILEGEIGSIANYIPHPIWPGGNSGITIGVGYDLGWHSLDELDQAWGAELDEVTISGLGKCCGIRGINAQRFLPSVRTVKIPWDSAERVFRFSTLPLYETMTQQAFPGWENLPPETYGALVALVYNRGASTSGVGREEMGVIRRHIGEGRFERIPNLIRSMSRLWLGSPDYPGMKTRRDAEADLAMEGLTAMKIYTSTRTW